MVYILDDRVPKFENLSMLEVKHYVNVNHNAYMDH